MTQNTSSPGGHEATHRVVIIGTGFGGLFATRKLRKAPVEVTVIGNTSHHLFQPLLYQVATGVLSQGEITPATREILRKQRNAKVLLGEVTAIDVAARTVTSQTLVGETVTPYDSLIVAAGAGQSYFGEAMLLMSGADTRRSATERPGKCRAMRIAATRRGISRKAA